MSLNKNMTEKLRTQRQVEEDNLKELKIRIAIIVVTPEERDLAGNTTLLHLSRN